MLSKLSLYEHVCKLSSKCITDHSLRCKCAFCAASKKKNANDLLFLNMYGVFISRYLVHIERKSKCKLQVVCQAHSPLLSTLRIAQCFSEISSVDDKVSGAYKEERVCHCQTFVFIRFCLALNQRL